MSQWYYIKLILTLGAFIALMWSLLQATKAFRAKRFSQEIKILDRLPVDNQVSLMIVDVRGKQYFLSVGGKDVKVLEVLV